jgi:predicted RNA-binding protein Jag
LNSEYNKEWGLNRSLSENSSVGRALPCQGKGRGFKSRFSLQNLLSFMYIFIYHTHRIIFMKSIIEQASSIMKAIEKAWNQAEQPKEFSIKIFEKEERNFFGMTTKPAKIGIFFGDKPIIHEKSTQRPRPEIKECRQTQKPPVIKQQEQSTVRPVAQPKPVQPRSQNIQEKVQPISTANTEKPRRASAAWNDTMITTAHNWLKKTLELMNMNTIQFNSEVAGKNLKLTFNTPLLADALHEKQLFRSFAHLIMSSLRNQYKQEIKDLKVILIRPE